MSAEHAKKFVDLVESDPQLQEELKNYEGKWIDVAARRGLSVTREEMHEALRARWGVQKTLDFPFPYTGNNGP